MKIRIVCFFLITLSCSLVQARATTGDTLEYRYPTEIIVTAPRLTMPLKELPFAASVVGNDVLNTMPRAVSADEALKLVPGVKVDNQSDAERVHLSIRGQGILTERGIRGIKILLDGIPMNDPTGFAPDFYDVDFAGVDHIEVLRGPAASLYGGSASGGIVNIMTHSPGNTPLYGDAQASYGSHNFWKGFGQFGGDVDKVNYNVSFSRSMGDGYRQHSAFWANNVYGKATYTPAEGVNIIPIFEYVHVYHQNPEGISLAYYQLDPTLPNDASIPLNEFLETERTTNGLRGHFALSSQHELDVTAFVKRTLFTESSNGVYNYRTFLAPGASVEYDYSMGEPSGAVNNRIGVGVDMQWQNVDQHLDDRRAVPDTLLSNERIKQRGAGIFLIDKLSIGKSWSVVASLRYDDIHNELDDFYFKDGADNSGAADFSKVTARIGATYTLIPEANLFASWGQGFLPPATEELLLNPDNAGLGGFNTHLTSATSQGIEAGSRGTVSAELSYDVTMFYLGTDNDFDRYRLPAWPQLTFYRNSGGTHRFGLEFYGRYSPIHELDVQVAYTYSNFKYTSDSPTRIAMDDTTIVKYVKAGNFLPNSPQHQVYVDAQYHIVPRFSLGFSVEALSKAFIDGADIDAEAVQGYALFHARAVYTWQLGGVLGELSVNARNIGNTKYVAFSEPDPGGNSYQPGPAREFFVGLKIHM